MPMVRPLRIFLPIHLINRITIDMREREKLRKFIPPPALSIQNLFIQTFLILMKLDFTKDNQAFQCQALKFPAWCPKKNAKKNFVV